MSSSLEQFYSEFMQNVSMALDSKESTLSEEMFTRVFSDYLEDFNEIDGIQTCNHVNEHYNTKLNGYYLGEELNKVDLFVSIYVKSGKLCHADRDLIEAAITKCENFYHHSIKGMAKDLEEATDEYDASIAILKSKDHIKDLHINVFTNLEYSDYEKQGIEINNTNVEYELWDITRLFEIVQAEENHETIHVDFPNPLIGVEIDNGDYSSYLTIIPAVVLSDIYEKYKLRILERNVRAFLQVKGKVNSGIKQTLSDEPQLFFAYNNGISAIASELNTEVINEKILIKSISGLQIVNGGQTTASIHHAYKEAHFDMSKVFVQMKITKIKNTDKEDDIVNNISKYANTQNSVQVSDFSANSPYHKGIERLSRQILATNYTIDRKYKWFYERIRGQYLIERNKSSSKEVFDLQYPKERVFTKLELAKFEMAWEQRPDVVSKGQQYCFQTFSSEYIQPAGKSKSKVTYTPDEIYYKKLIAKAILFRETARIVKEQKFPGYAANILAYTVSILSYYSYRKVNLDTIWRDQAIDSSLEVLIAKLTYSVRESFMKNAGEENVGSYCKKPACWKAMIDDSKSWGFITDKSDIYSKTETVKTEDESLYSNLNEKMRIISYTEPNLWFTISKWGKETGYLTPWQRQFSFTIGYQLGRKTQLTAKQIHFCILVLKDAYESGFALDKNIIDLVKILPKDD